MTLDWLVYVLGVVAVVFLVVMFFKYKKHNRYADKFEDTYPAQSRIIDNNLPRLQDNMSSSCLNVL